MRILVVEDEHRIAQAVKEGLEQEKYAVDVEYDGEQGFNAASSTEYDLILLDIMLPGMDGINISTNLRAKGIHTPILMLTARDQEKDIVRGLDSGADDYLAKPFSFDVLLARVRALLRRPHDSLPDVIYARDLTLDINNQIVKRAGKEIRLSAKEYAILNYLLRNKNKVVSKNNIMSHVWDFDSDILPNNVEVMINYLRSKIDKPFEGPPIIETVRGFGYRIMD